MKIGACRNFAFSRPWESCINFKLAKLSGILYVLETLQSSELVAETALPGLFYSPQAPSRSVQLRDGALHRCGYRKVGAGTAAMLKFEYVGSTWYTVSSLQPQKCLKSCERQPVMKTRSPQNRETYKERERDILARLQRWRSSWCC